jgi:hypothetical protein
MNIKHIAAASLIALAGSAAFAQTTDQADSFQPTLTRAQVQADLAQARANGTAFHEGDITYVQHAPAKSLKTRAEVQAELAQARADGTLFVAGDTDYPQAQKFVSTRTRAEVQAEAREATRFTVDRDGHNG